MTHLAFIVKMVNIISLSPPSYIFVLSVFSGICLLGLLIIDLLSTYEVLDGLSVNHTSSPLVSTPHRTDNPKVSIHIPIYREPVPVVRETLLSISKLEYPNFEVVVVYNNTKEKKLWQPIEALCKQLGFTFIYIPKLSGFKAGALNRALRDTSADAEIIAVLDSDYAVSSQFLKTTTPYFQDIQLGFLQTCPGFRKHQDNRFQKACRIAQQAFYKVIMPSRQQGESVMFGGTVGLLRKQVLEDIGGWDETCIGEDAELSLRLLEANYKGRYVDVELGWGLLPENFKELKKQRRRWTIGGIHTFKRHVKNLVFGEHSQNKKALSLRQRFHHISAYLQWFSAVWVTIFTGIIIFILFNYLFFQYPIPPLITAPEIMLALASIVLVWRVRFLWAVQVRLSISLREATDAILVLQALTITQALACIKGIFSEKAFFERTSKFVNFPDNRKSLFSNIIEFIIGLVCILLAGGIWFFANDFGVAILFSVTFLWLSAPYLSFLQILYWNK